MSVLESVSHVHKRRRVPKSCFACRTKKLRCDRVRPRCSSCTIRQIVSCEYADGSASDEQSRETSVEMEVALPIPQAVTPPPTAGNNPCLQFAYFHRDANTGKTMSQGPTSLKAFVSNIHPPFTEKFDRLWRMTEPERLQWQEDHKERLEQLNPLGSSGPLTQAEVSVQELSKALPPFNELHSSVNTFFTASPLYDINTVLSATETLKDFYMIFNTDEEERWRLQDRFVKKLTGPLNRHHYKLGTLLMIHRIVASRDVVNPIIETYLRQLEGSIVPGGSHVIQLQFLMLRWFHRKVYFTKVDDTVLLSLVGQLVDTAMDMGLHLDIEKVYADYEGDVLILKNMWLWIQYADLSVSFQFGRPLRISPAVYRNFAYNNVEQSSFIKKLCRFANIAREIYDSIYAPSVSPDLATGSKHLKQFIVVEFQNLGDYYTLARNKETALSETRILMLGLGILMSLYSLRFKVMGERSIELKNNFAQTTLMSLHIISCLLKHCYLEDVKGNIYPEDEMASLPPFLNMAISLSEGVFQRAQMNFMALIYYKITLFHQEAFRTHDLQTVEWTLDTIDVQTDKVVTLKTSFDMYMEIFGNWREPQVRGMVGLFQRSYPLFLMLLLENKSRHMVEKVIQFRQKSEQSIRACFEQRQRPDTSSTTAASTPASTHPDHQSRDTDIPQEEQQYLLEDSISSQIYDEFWDSFNSYWEGLLREEQVPSLDFT